MGEVQAYDLVIALHYYSLCLAQGTIEQCDQIDHIGNTVADLHSLAVDMRLLHGLVSCNYSIVAHAPNTLALNVPLARSEL